MDMRLGHGAFETVVVQLVLDQIHAVMDDRSELPGSLGRNGAAQSRWRPSDKVNLVESRQIGREPFRFPSAAPRGAEPKTQPRVSATRPVCERSLSVMMISRLKMLI